MPKKRFEQVLDIIKEQRYVTVKYLCDNLHYSTATINRDLNDLQRQKLIVRHYGGAEFIEKKGVPLVFRFNKMRPVKRAISKQAAADIKEGMTVFIDGSTTAQYMAEYIQNIKNITVITKQAHSSMTKVRVTKILYRTDSRLTFRLGKKSVHILIHIHM